MKVACQRSGTTTRVIIYLVGLLVLFLFLSPDASSAERAVGRLVVAHGGVTLEKPGNEAARDARPGDVVFVGDILETRGEGHAQLLLTDESVMTLSSGTAMRVNQYSFDAATNRRTAEVRVFKGKIRIVLYIERNNESSFKVVTDHALISPSDSDFVVIVSEGETSLVVLYGGATVVNSSKFTVGTVNLGQNQLTVVRGKNPPSVPSVITEEQRRAYIRDAKLF